MRSVASVLIQTSLTTKRPCSAALSTKRRGNHAGMVVNGKAAMQAAATRKQPTSKGIAPTRLAMAGTKGAVTSSATAPAVPLRPLKAVE